MLKALAGLGVWMLMLSLLPLCAAVRDPVRVQGGLISGDAATKDGVRAFKGIPYAAPPVGKLRWRPPQPPPPWSGVRRADHYASTCYQAPSPKGSYYQKEFYRVPEPTSEDCLYLNVWTAAASPQERRPVMVWIHGGGFANGAGSTPVFDGTELAKKGVVAVTINYRLGVFGLLAHPELTRESEHHSSGNYTLEDQIAALRWVRDNISAFGGDPRQVTIFGQSAGGASVALLMASPLAKGLFVRAIAESIGFVGEDYSSLPQAEQAGKKFAESVGAFNLESLRQVPAAELLRAGDRKFRPIIDGYVIPEDVYSIYAAGKQARVPLLLGSVANEQGNYPHPQNLEQYLEYTRRAYGQKAEDVLKQFPARTDAEAVATYLDRESENRAAAMQVWADFAVKAGEPVYLFWFDRKPPARPGEPRLGAVHTSEIAYVMNNLDKIDRPWEPIDRKLAGIMSSYWVNFAKTGNPNGEDLPHWPEYSPGKIMELGDHAGPIPMPHLAGVEFYKRYYTSRHELSGKPVATRTRS